jgi:hypothetical protein
MDSPFVGLRFPMDVIIFEDDLDFDSSDLVLYAQDKNKTKDPYDEGENIPR